MKIVSLLLIFLMIFTGCAPDGNIKKSAIGSVGGGALGALLGYTIGGKGAGGTLAIAAGAILGSLGGGIIGQKLDEKDKQMHANAQYEALEYHKSGSPAKWVNPDSNASGEIVPVNTYINNKGENCREYRLKIMVGSKEEEGYGKACRGPDGSWQIIK